MAHNFPPYTRRKSQSALEYIMTYGWAILIIIIVAGVLYSLGIFNPAASAGTSINGFSGVKVLSTAITSNELEVQLANEVGSPVTINYVNATYNSQTYTSFQCQQTSLATGGSTICAVFGTFGSPRTTAQVTVGYTSSGVFQSKYSSYGVVAANLVSSISNNPILAPTNVAYVGSWDGVISEINTTSNTLITSVGNTVWGGPSQMIFSSNGSLAYITDSWTTLGIFKVPGLQVVRKYWTNGCNHYGALSNNGEYFFNTVDCGNYIDITNLSSPNTYFDFETVTVGSNPETILNLNNVLYVLNRGSNSISLVGATNFTNFATINNIGDADSATYNMAYDSGNGNLYITNDNDNYNNISIVSTTSKQLVGGINSIGQNTQYGVLSPNGKLLYITDSCDSRSGNCGKLSILNLSNYAVIKNILVGSEPLGVAVDSSTGDIWVANFNSNTVMVINPTTYSIITTVSGFNGPMDVVVDGGSAYVTNYNTNTVSVVSTSSYSITATLTVGSNPRRLAVSPVNSSKIYVANWGSNTLSVINTVNNAVGTIGNLHSCGNPDSIAFAPNKNTAYVACWNNNVMEIINTSTDSWSVEVSGIETLNGGGLDAITVSPDGNYVYIGNWGNNPAQLVKIFTANNSVAKREIVSTSLSYLLFSSDGSKLYALFDWDPVANLVTYNPSTLQIISTIGGFFDPYGIAISPNNKYLAVANTANEGASIVNLSSGAVVTVSDRWGGTYWAVFSPDSKFAYFSSGWDLMRVSLSNYSTESLFTGSSSGPLTISPDGKYLYEQLGAGTDAYNYPHGGTVTISLNPFQVVNTTFQVGITPNGLAVSPDGSHLYIDNHDGSGFAILNTLTNQVMYNEIDPFPPNNPWAVVSVGNIAYSAIESANYGSLNNSGGIAIINLSSDTSIGSIQGLGESITSLAISSDGQTLYAISRAPMTPTNGSYQSELYTVSIATKTVTNKMIIPGCPYTMRLMPNGNQIVYADPCYNKVVFVSLSNYSVSNRISVACGAQSAAPTPDGKFIITADTCGYASIVNVSSRTDIYDISGLNDPQDVALTPNGAEAYFPDWNDNLVHVLNVTAAIAKSASPWIASIATPSSYLREVVAGSGTYADW